MSLLWIKTAAWGEYYSRYSGPEHPDHHSHDWNHEAFGEPPKEFGEASRRQRDTTHQVLSEHGVRAESPVNPHAPKDAETISHLKVPLETGHHLSIHMPASARDYGIDHQDNPEYSQEGTRSDESSYRIRAFAPGHDAWSAGPWTPHVFPNSKTPGHEDEFIPEHNTHSDNPHELHEHIRRFVNNPDFHQWARSTMQPK